MDAILHPTLSGSFTESHIGLLTGLNLGRLALERYLFLTILCHLVGTFLLNIVSVFVNGQM